MDDLSQIFQHDRLAPPAEDAKSAPKRVERERIFEAVRRKIVDGSIPPGARLTERGLCDAFGVSRTVVREVIRMIAAEKLGDFEPHVGLRVAELTHKHVQEIYAIRTELEAMVVRGFLSAATDTDIAVAESYGRKMLEIAAQGDRFAAVEMMAEFERFMARVADNEIAAELLSQLNARISILRLVAMREPGQVETGMEGVRAVVASIVARETDAAEHAVRTFVRRSGEAVLRHMERTTVSPTTISEPTEEDITP